MGDDEQSFTDGGDMLQLRLFQQGFGTEVNGKQKTLHPPTNPGSVQLLSNHILHMDLLRGSSDFLFFFVFRFRMTRSSTLRRGRHLVVEALCLFTSIGLRD